MMGVSNSTAVILPVVASTQTSVRSFFGGSAISTDQISSPFSLSSSTHLIAPRLTLANAIFFACFFVTRACFSNSLCCAHKLKGIQLVASANAITEPAIGFMGNFDQSEHQRVRSLSVFLRLKAARVAP